MKTECLDVNGSNKRVQKLHNEDIYLSRIYNSSHKMEDDAK